MYLPPFEVREFQDVDLLATCECRSDWAGASASPPSAHEEQKRHLYEDATPHHNEIESFRYVSVRALAEY